MTAINYTQFRDHMKTYMDDVTDNYDPVFITRKENRNVYLMGNKANYDWLIESRKQLEAGKSKVHELVNADDD